MSSQKYNIVASPAAKSLKFRALLDWLDVLAIPAWDVLLLTYWLNGKLGLLVHPRYFWLNIVTGFLLLIIAALKAWALLQKRQKPRQVQHLTVFPPGWSSGLLHQFPAVSDEI